MKSLLVTGTDTDVGKTWVSGVILRRLVADGRRVGAYKPVCSGAEIANDGQLVWSDAELLRSSINDADLNLVCPQRFNAPVAPNVAAEMEGRRVDDDLLVSGFKDWTSRADLVLVEGAGGLHCPLSNQMTVADLAVQLASPIVIVAANRLGVINHTLLTVAFAESRNIPIAAVVLNEATQTLDDESRDSNLAQLNKWLQDIPVLTCRHNATTFHHSAPVNPADWFQ